MYYQQELWWSGKYSFILNQEASGSIHLGYGVVFVRERFTPQYGTSRRESEFSRAPMWVPNTGWKIKKNYDTIEKMQKDHEEEDTERIMEER
ncbi:hypothetical protein H5410_038028 [Solanum commersonii]|uniref:Uncharacterized protein n=1 Tax=Solanum commersonii TaxID=4109 RepID=A0A9J5YBX5_SOLCO|nr:hypothetical protein H5410_038028 [Solanum commersonii]